MITSTFRTERRQAEIMYANCEINLEGQRHLYAPTGQTVIDTYEENKRANKPKEQIIQAMTSKIQELARGGKKTSNHVTSEEGYRKRNIVDLGRNSMLRANGHQTDLINKITKQFNIMVSNEQISRVLDEM